MKKCFILFAILIALVSCESSQQLSSINNSPEVSDENTVAEKIQVSASIVPLASIVNRVGGNYVDVQTIVPAGISPHGFDLSARKVAEMSDNQAIFMIGSEEID